MPPPGTNLWSERFEGKIDDIFALQDQLTADVVGAIAPQLERAEIERAKHKPTESLDAYDYYLRAMAKSCILGPGRRSARRCRCSPKRSSCDPEFAPAYAMAAWCHFLRKVNRWMIDRAREIAEGTRLTRRAIELGMDDAVALTRAGHALAHLAGDLDARTRLARPGEGAQSEPGAAWFLGGFVRVWRGDPDGAIEHFGSGDASQSAGSGNVPDAGGNGRGASVRRPLRRSLVMGRKVIPATCPAS